MKKDRSSGFALRTLLCMLALTALMLTAGVCFAQDDGYYIRHMSVDVTANADRTFDIVETIDVHFNEERHGIIRSIPTYSSLEREIRLENVSVEGAPFEYDGYEDIQIGDPDKTVTGDVRYVIRYTLWHYADEEPDYDYLYLNLIGTEWDTRIESFDATVRLPDQAEVNNITLTSGRYGSDENDAASWSQEGNLISVQGQRGLDAYEGVTINVEMLEGAFPDAEVWQPDLVFHSVSANAQLDDHGVLHVEQRYDITVNQGSSFSLRLTDSSERNKSRVENVQLSYPNGEVQREEDRYVYFDLYDYEDQRISLTLSYDKIYDLAEGENELEVEQLVYSGSYSDVCESADFTFSAPFAIEQAQARRYLNIAYGTYEESQYQVELNGQTASVRMPEIEDPSDDIYVTFWLPSINIVRDQGAFDRILPAICAGSLILVLVLVILKRGKRLNPVPEFYPPEGINPAELGYIIDEKADKQDIVSLIYYWASKKLLRIEMKADDEFTLYKLKNVDGSYRDYEQKLFNALWSNGRRTVVSSASLQNSYYKRVNEAVEAVRNQFTGPNVLSNRNFKLISYLLGLLLPAICMVITLIAVGARGFGVVAEIFIMLAVFVIDLTVFYTASHWQQTHYKGKNAFVAILKILWLAVRVGGASLWCFSMLNGRALSTQGAAVTAACLNLIPFAAPFVRRRTMLGQTLLERALGFRMFLQTAEKERLQMLLDENPEYYYDILPYAQVLGVSKQWENKFAGLYMEPPSWLDSHDSTITASLALHSLSRSMRSNMTSMPSSSGGSSGGGFSGGGGGFSGGGFSGGGSGGGGGSSW